MDGSGGGRRRGRSQWGSRDASEDATRRLLPSLLLERSRLPSLPGDEGRGGAQPGRAAREASRGAGGGGGGLWGAVRMRARAPSRLRRCSAPGRVCGCARARSGGARPERC